MIDAPDLTKLSHAEKEPLILALLRQLAVSEARIAAQDARIAALEPRLDELTRPPKTPDNSSKPPSQRQKPDSPAANRAPRKSRPGVGRMLHPNPDWVIVARLAACPNCATAFPDALQTPQQIYERIELPPIRPDVTQVRLFGCRYACCGERVTAAAPAGLEQGSPFGQSIAALVVRGGSVSRYSVAVPLSGSSRRWTARRRGSAGRHRGRPRRPAWPRRPDRGSA